MAKCNELKMGQVYICPDCGVELQVVKECAECGRRRRRASAR